MLPPAVTLSSPDGTLRATYIPQLGMICSSLRHHDDELLAQHGGIDAYATKGSTFALPLLYPWANRLLRWEYNAAGTHVQLTREQPLLHIDPDQDVPIHGVLAACPDWQVEDHDEQSLEATLDYGADSDRLKAFPFPHTVGYQARVNDEGLQVTLTVTADQGSQVPVSFGFHPYLTLPGSDRRSWQIRLPVPGAYIEPQPLASRVFDDPFPRLEGSPPVFTVADKRRQVSVEFSDNFPVAQVYAPEGSDFICFEPMTAPVNALCSGDGLRIVEPGQSFSASFRIAVTARL